MQPIPIVRVVFLIAGKKPTADEVINIIIPFQPESMIVNETINITMHIINLL